MYTITFCDPDRADVHALCDGASSSGSMVLRGPMDDLDALLTRVALIEQILGRPVSGGVISWMNNPGFRVFFADLTPGLPTGPMRRWAGGLLDLVDDAYDDDGDVARAVWRFATHRAGLPAPAGTWEAYIQEEAR